MTLTSSGWGCAALILLAGACSTDRHARGPAWVANPRATPAGEMTVGGARFISQTEAAQLLNVDSMFPQQDVRLLWFNGHIAAPLPDGSVVTLDGSGGAIRVDQGLFASRLPLGLGAQEPVSIAADVDGWVWVADAQGNIRRLRPGGMPQRVIGLPADHPALARDPRGGVWLARLSEAASGSQDREPLLARLDAAGARTDSLPGVTAAGPVLITDEVVYFVASDGGELLALTREGDTLWVARRDRGGEGADSQEMRSDAVNMGIAAGIDGLVYVASRARSAADSSRIDVYDGVTGRLLRTASLNTARPTVAADAEGRLYVVDPFRVLTGVAPTDRLPLAPFALATLDGDTLSNDDLLGRVVLMNFWASWCAPCRVEMPALIQLAASVPSPDFAFVTMNDDVDADDGRRFAFEVGLDHPVALGRGRLRRRYHYLGLPFTVVLDRAGRIVYRWTGFAGDEQIEGVRAVIRAELERDYPHADGGSGTPVNRPHPPD